METNELKWEAHGDVNPFDHGGLWVLPSKDTDTVVSMEVKGNE